MTKKNSKHHWRSHQSQESYFKKSKIKGFRSRSTFKLIEIDNKYRILKPFISILDLGASPGGWSQYSVYKLNNKGTVIASDIVPMKKIENVEFILGDFRKHEHSRNNIRRKLNEKI